MNVFIRKNKLVDFFCQRVWLFYFVIALVVFNWFDPGAVILGGDFGWPQFFSNFFHSSGHAWDSTVNFGYSAIRQLASFYPYALSGFALERIGLSPQAIQAFIFYISFAFSGFGFYLFARKLGLGKVGSFIAGIIYMFSPYALIVAWNPVYGITFPFYSFLPLMLFFFVSFLTEQEGKSKVIYLLSSFLLYFGTSYSNPVYFILFLILSFSFFLYFLLVSKDIRLILVKNFVCFFFLYILFNSFWIFPLAFNFNSEFVSADNVTAGLITDKETMKLNSVTILDALRLRGLWTTYASQGFDDYYFDWHANIYSPVYIIFSFIYPFLIALALLLRKGYGVATNRRIVLFMAALFLVGILLNSGFRAGGTLEIINSCIYTSYTERIFRTVYLKLAILLVIPAAFLMGYSIENLYHKLDKQKSYLVKYVFVLIFLVLFFYFEGAPFLNGKIIKSSGNFLPSYNVKIPEEYYDLHALDSYLKLDGRYVAFPLSRSYNNILKWDDGGYNGGDFLRFFLNDKPLVYQHNNNDYVNRIKESVLGNDYDNIVRMLGLSNIKYVFSHYDLEPRAYFKGISSTKDFKTEKISDDKFENILSNKYFKVGAVSNDNFLPHFYTPNSIIITPNNVGVLSDILSVPEHSERSAVYFNEQIGILNHIKDEGSLFLKPFISSGLTVSLPVGSTSVPDSSGSFGSDSSSSGNTLYKSSTGNAFEIIISYDSEKRAVIFSAKITEGISINKEKIDAKTLVLNEVKANIGDILKIGSSYFVVERDLNENVVFNYDSREVRIYKKIPRSPVYLANNSFESGLWQEKPEDCSNGSVGEPRLSMQLSKDSTDGRQSLELGSKNHFACIGKSFEVSLSKNKVYKYSFDYKNVKGEKVDFGYHFSGQEKNYPFGESILAENNEWNHFEAFVEPDEDINNVVLYFYAPSDGTKEIINRFDNIKLEEWMSRDVFNYYLYSPSGAKIKNPILEFKKISPTKYRVRVHGAKGGFPLVFSESFHEGWKGYLVKTEPAKVRIKADLANKVSSYRVLDGNDDDQANREELLDYISKGWVTELGDDEQKTIIHNKWENGERRLDYLEKYSIDFVSKNFQDTIQNDNLQNGAFYEAWFEKPLPEEEHLPVNGYANSWYIEVEKNCNEYSNKCIKNADGSYDMELVVEFEPQRLFYIGLFVSGMALFCCLVYLGYSFAKRRK